MIRGFNSVPGHSRRQLLADLRDLSISCLPLACTLLLIIGIFFCAGLRGPIPESVLEAHQTMAPQPQESYIGIGGEADVPATKRPKPVTAAPARGKHRAKVADHRESTSDQDENVSCPVTTLANP